MKSIYIIALISLVFTFNSCSLSDTSENSITETEVDASELLEAAISQVAFNQVSFSARLSGIYIDYFKEGDSKVFTSYIISPVNFENVWTHGYYTGSLASAKKLKDLAQEQNSTDLEGISLILLAHEYSNLTNLFGDIPYTESLLEVENTTPVYDRQEEIYAAIINILDEAILLLESSSLNADISETDLLFNGDMMRWRKFAFGLKARTLLNLRNQQNDVDQDILQALDQSFASANEQAVYFFGEDRPNPLYTFNLERPSTYFLSGTFMQRLLNKDDPRFSRYTSGPTSDPSLYEWGDSANLTWSRKDSEIPLLSYAEILFMKAEILHHQNASIEVIEEALQEAVRENMELNRLNALGEEVSEYITSHLSLTNLSSDQRYTIILEEAYISYYGFNFIQSWNNKRRTNIPELVTEDIPSSMFNPSGIIPVRFLYPTSEYDYNLVNLQEGLDAQDGGLADRSIWVFE